MYPIALAALVGVAIILERAAFLFGAARMNKAALLRGLETALKEAASTAAFASSPASAPPRSSSS